MTARSRRLPSTRIAAAAGVLALALTGCGAAASSSTPAGGAAAPSSSAGVAASEVLPAPSNPITNTSTAPGLTVGTVLVENNIDPATKKVTSDHLEIPLSNTLATPLTGIEIYYTFTDKTAGASESYYAKLPAGFSIPAGGTRTVNFDNTGKPDHFPVNKFSIYHTSKNALDVSVEVSATGVGVQKATATKAAGGAETAD